MEVLLRIVLYAVVGTYLFYEGYQAIDDPKMIGIRWIGEIEPDSEVSETEAGTSKLIGGLLLALSLLFYLIILSEIYYLLFN